MHDFGPLVRVHAAHDPDRGVAHPHLPRRSGHGGSARRPRWRGDDRLPRTDRPRRPPRRTLLRRPLRLRRASPSASSAPTHEGTGTDVHPLTLVSQASVRELARRGGHDGDLDARRFRMTLELDETQPFEEDTWTGRSVQVGEAVLRVHGPVPRCRVTTYAPDTGLKDWDTLTQITRFRPLMSGERGSRSGCMRRWNGRDMLRSAARSCSSTATSRSETPCRREPFSVLGIR